jgi:hypothetical protein
LSEERLAERMPEVSRPGSLRRANAHAAPVSGASTIATDHTSSVSKPSTVARSCGEQFTVGR